MINTEKTSCIFSSFIPDTTNVYFQIAYKTSSI